MTEQEILKNIEIILYNATYTDTKQGIRFYSSVQDGSTFYYEFHNEAVELLIALYQRLITNKEKEFLLKSLGPKGGFFIFAAKQPKTAQLVLSHQDFIFMFLIKIKETDKALKMISDKIVVASTNNLLFHALSELLIFEPQTFDSTKLDEILLIVDHFNIFINDLKAFQTNKRYSLNGVQLTPAFDTKKIDDYKASDASKVYECEQLLKKIKDRAYKIEHERLSASLREGINYEINQDQKELQTIIAEFGFDKELNEIVSKIDKELYNAKDPFDFTSCIGHIRTLFERLCISIAIEIEKKKGISSTDSPIDKMGKARAYFRYEKIDFLSKEEDDLIDRFFYFLSNKGSHALQSEREYARISRNLVIELGLFLVERLKKYLS